MNFFGLQYFKSRKRSIIYFCCGFAIGLSILYVIKKANFSSSRLNDSSIDENLALIPEKILEKIIKKVNIRILPNLLSSYERYLDNFKKIDGGHYSHNPNISLDINNIEVNSKDIIRNFKQFINTKMFRQILIDKEIEVINECGYNRELYRNSLKKYINTNINIKKNVLLIREFVDNLKEDKLLDVKFDENLVKNYIKAVSNIYFINIGKIQRSFQSDYIDKGIIFKNDREVYEILHNIYNRYLKETRRQICKFFNIRDSQDLDVKLMLRIYYYYLPKDDPNRIMMDYLNFQVSHIIDRISIGYKFKIFLSDDHPFNYKEPIDEIMDFTKVIENKVLNEKMKYQNENILNYINQIREKSEKEYLLNYSKYQMKLKTTVHKNLNS